MLIKSPELFHMSHTFCTSLSLSVPLQTLRQVALLILKGPLAQTLCDLTMKGK